MSKSNNENKKHLKTGTPYPYQTQRGRCESIVQYCEKEPGKRNNSAQDLVGYVEEKSKWEIYEILTQNIPLQNVPLIEDDWNVGGTEKVKQVSKKVGLFPDRDTDYQVILRDDVPNFYHEETELPSSNYLAQETAYWYLISVIKGLISSLSAYDCFDPAHFANLTNY